MSALKWHLCDRLWEMKPPMRIVTDSGTEPLDETARDAATDEASYEDEDEGERVDHFPASPPAVQLFWAS